MSWLSRGVRKLQRSKLAKSIASSVIKATPLGAASMRVIHAAKQLGVGVLGARAQKRTGTAVNAALTSLANTKRPTVQLIPSGRKEGQWIKEAVGPDMFPQNGYAHEAETVKENRRLARKAKAKAKAKATKPPKAPKAPKAKTTRKPPKGGLDLKALSASWKAAGKPGTWIGWVKSKGKKG